MKFKKSEEEQEKHLNFLSSILTDKRLTLEEPFYDSLKNEYIKISNMSSFDYFKQMTIGCSYDDKTNDAFSIENPNAFYKYEVCKQKNLEENGQESDFSDPFILKNGTKSYSARFNDIDWSIKHLNNEKIFLYNKIWSLVVEGNKPQTEQEEELRDMFIERKHYFNTTFSSKEEYLAYNCCVWFDGVATEERFEQLDFKCSNYTWFSTFFDLYLDHLKETNPLLTIYEISSL